MYHIGQLTPHFIPHYSNILFIYSGINLSSIANQLNIKYTKLRPHSSKNCCHNHTLQTHQCIHRTCTITLITNQPQISSTNHRFTSFNQFLITVCIIVRHFSNIQLAYKVKPSPNQNSNQKSNQNCKCDCSASLKLSNHKQVWGHQRTI